MSKSLHLPWYASLSLARMTFVSVFLPWPFLPALVSLGLCAIIAGRASSSFHADVSFAVSAFAAASVIVLAVRLKSCAIPVVHCGGRFLMVGGL